METENDVKVLVVGGSGFLGRHLVARLCAAGHDVESWSRRAAPSAAAVRWRRVDLTDGAPLPAPPAGGWEAAFQLAAQALPERVHGPEGVIENLTMTARVIDHLRDTSPGCRTVLVSSAHVYAPSERPHREDDPLRPRGDYGLSKLLCEDWARARASEELPIAIVRPFNQVGPGMPKGLLVPDLLARLREGGRRLEMRGRDATRDFLDVRDGARALVSLLEAEWRPGEAFNLCSGRALRVSEWIAAVLEHLGESREVHFADPAPDTLVGDPARLVEATGWRPEHTLEQTVAYLLEAADG